MQAPNSDVSSFGELPPPSDGNQIECFEAHEHGANHSCKQALPASEPLYKIDVFPQKRPSNSELKKIVVDYYDELCSNTELIGLGATQYSRYMSTIDELALQAVSACAQVKPLNILSIGAGTASREEIILTNFRNSISSLVINDASMKMCTKAAMKGFDVIPGFFQDLCIQAQMVGFDMVMALDCTENLSTIDELRCFMQNISISLTQHGVLLIDFFNINEPDGWGRKIRQAHADESLAARGFDLGEYFYRRKGLENVGYARFFESRQIREVFEENKLAPIALEHYDQRTGDLTDESNASSHIFLLQKQ